MANSAAKKNSDDLEKRIAARKQKSKPSKPAKDEPILKVLPSGKAVAADKGSTPFVETKAIGKKPSAVTKPAAAPAESPNPMVGDLPKARKPRATKPRAAAAGAPDVSGLLDKIRKSTEKKSAAAHKKEIAALKKAHKAELKEETKAAYAAGVEKGEKMGAKAAMKSITAALKGK